MSPLFWPLIYYSDALIPEFVFFLLVLVSMLTVVYYQFYSGEEFFFPKDVDTHGKHGEAEGEQEQEEDQGDLGVTAEEDSLMQNELVGV